MSGSHEVMLAGTSRFLARVYGSGVEDVRQIGVGTWSRAYAFRHDGIEQVIRFSRFADNFERDAFAARFNSPDLPIPHITRLGRAGEHHYAISPFAHGDYLEQLSASELERTVPSLLRLLRALRAVDLAWFVFYEPWYPQFTTIDLIGRLLDDVRADPNANSHNLDARLRCYVTHIGLDSIAYNTSRQRWANAQEAANRVWDLLRAG